MVERAEHRMDGVAKSARKTQTALSLKLAQLK